MTFRLKHGSGPVFVGAEHVACKFVLSLFNLMVPHLKSNCSNEQILLLVEDYSDEEMDDEMDEEEVEEEEEDIEESPVKKVTKNGASKVRSTFYLSFHLFKWLWYSDSLNFYLFIFRERSQKRGMMKGKF